MYGSLAFFKTASALAQHASTRQTVIAQNIANADTPDFKARDVASFSESMTDTGRSVNLHATRPGHVSSSTSNAQEPLMAEDSLGDASPNGNTVSLETEMVKSSEVKQQHELAVATYRSGMDLLRTALGRG